jgi:DNA polymerase-1
MLLLVDGSNILMRCAFGGDTPPERSTPIAVSLIEHAANQLKATHLVIAMDSSTAPSWRKLEYDAYKAHRKTSTAPWLTFGRMAFAERGWHMEEHAGFEADDVLATIATRAPVNTTVLSSDSDLLPLVSRGITVVRPMPGGQLRAKSPADVTAKYDIPAPSLLVDWKAMVGEPGDGVPGVPGIGPRRASTLLKVWGPLESIITAGQGNMDKHSAIVAEHADVARRALRLVTLRTDAPVPPITPKLCRLLAG